MNPYLYLHGFASSPASHKAQALRQSLATCNISLDCPDLNEPSFSDLTLTRQIHAAQAMLATWPTTAAVTLIGSSFGGLTAAWVAERSPQVQRVILLAPAFEFLDHWLPRLGAAQVQQWQTSGLMAVYHHRDQAMQPLKYNFVTDAQTYDESELQRPVPTLILHGRQDDVIPLDASQHYAASRPWVQLIELDSDHTLGNVAAEIWAAVRSFCHLDTAMAPD